MQHHSDDEEDFLSADEDGFADQQQHKAQRAKSSISLLSKEDFDKSNSTEKHIEQNTTEGKRDNTGEDETTCADEQPGVDHENILIEDRSGVETQQRKSEQKTAILDDDDEDDEEALSERVRERNLKIARKFSAEIARNIKASAPIPVKGFTPKGLKSSDIEYQNIPGSDTKSGLPPAPPPTPALSSPTELGIYRD